MTSKEDLVRVYMEEIKALRKENENIKNKLQEVEAHLEIKNNTYEDR